MNPIYWYSTGHAATLLPTLIRTFAAYAWRSKWIKVGITCQPELRLYQHQRSLKPRDRWKRMVVVYRSGSWDSVCWIEDELISYARERGWEDRVYNAVAGGGGRRPDKCGPYWVYFLTY